MMIAEQLLVSKTFSSKAVLGDLTTYGHRGDRLDLASWGPRNSAHEQDSDLDLRRWT